MFPVEAGREGARIAWWPLGVWARNRKRTIDGWRVSLHSFITLVCAGADSPLIAAMYSSDRHSNNPFLTPNRAHSVSPGPSSPGISRMGSPNHLAYGPRAGSSPTGYTPSTSQHALIPPQQQGQMQDGGAVPLSRQSSASSMNSGDGFFRNGRYAAGTASPVGGMSRSSSPMYEGQTVPYGAVANGARGRGVNEKAGYPGTPSSMAPSMQDKVRPLFLLPLFAC